MRSQTLPFASVAESFLQALNDSNLLPIVFRFDVATSLPYNLVINMYCPFILTTYLFWQPYEPYIQA